MGRAIDLFNYSISGKAKFAKLSNGIYEFPEGFIIRWNNCVDLLESLKEQVILATTNMDNLEKEHFSIVTSQHTKY